MSKTPILTSDDQTKQTKTSWGD